MDLVTTISVVAGITAALSWISLRWLKTTTIGVPALAASLFIAVVQFTHSGSSTAWKSTLWVVLQTGGGIILGIAASWVGAQAIDGVKDRRTTVLVVVALLFIAFLTSRYFGLAGPLEAVASGIAFPLFSHNRESRQIEDTHSPEFWNAIADIENSVLFVLLGLSVAAYGVTTIAITLGVAGFLTTILIRFASTGLPIFLLSKRDSSDLSSALLRALGGLKGGMPIALALAIPYSATRSWILGATFIVAVLSTVVQGGMIGWVAPSGGHKTGRPVLLHIKEGTR